MAWFRWWGGRCGRDVFVDPEVGVDLLEHIGGFRLHHGEEFHTGGLEFAELVAIEPTACIRTAQKIDPAEQVAGLGIKLGKPVVVEIGYEIFVLVLVAPTFFCRQKVHAAVEVGLGLAVVASERFSGGIDRRCECVGRAFCSAGVTPIRQARNGQRKHCGQ